MDFIYLNVVLIGVSAYLAGKFDDPFSKAINVFAALMNTGVVIYYFNR